MLTYLSVRGFDRGPLFKTEQGLPLIRAKLVTPLKSALTVLTRLATLVIHFELELPRQLQQMGLVMRQSRRWGGGPVTHTCGIFAYPSSR